VFLGPARTTKSADVTGDGDALVCRAFFADADEIWQSPAKITTMAVFGIQVE
jgi:hypothetical protein